MQDRWAWIVLRIAAISAVFGLFLMGIAKVPEGKVFGSNPEPILSPGNMNLRAWTPDPSVDTETCRRVRTANPQTLEAIGKMYPGIPLSLVQLETYDGCDIPRHSYGAFHFWSEDKEYILRVPPGGEIIVYDEAPAKVACEGETVRARIAMVRGISLLCPTK